jgi:hypothetical protein
MAGSQLYTLAYVTVDGSILTEEASVTVNRATNSQAVNTVAKGYAGESPGAPSVEIQVSSAVPSADFEMNPGKYMKALKEVEIGVLAAGKQLTARGFIISDSFKHSVGAESSLEFSFRGAFVDFE